MRAERAAGSPRRSPTRGQSSGGGGGDGVPAPVPSERARNTNVHLGFCCRPGFTRPLSQRRGSSPIPAGTPVTQERMGGEGRVSRSGAGAPGPRQSREGWIGTRFAGSPLWKCPRGSSPWGRGAGAVGLRSWSKAVVEAGACRARQAPGGFVGLLELANAGLVKQMLLGHFVSCH